MSATRFHAQWEPQWAVILVWPHADTDWRGQLDQVELAYRQIVLAIAPHQHLIIVCRDPAHRTHIENTLSRYRLPPTAVQWVTAPYNDTWIRDTGPVCIEANGSLCLLDFRFDGWGGRYPAALDDQLTANLHNQAVFSGYPLQRQEQVLEGGALETDGLGSLLVSEESVQARFASHRLFEQVMSRLLGIQRVLYLRNGRLEGDDTDGHIDMLARFCNPVSLAYMHCDDPQDTHYPAMQAMQDELRALRTADGQAYRLVPLPWPRASYHADGHRLPLSYANFLITNRTVLVPQYDDPADRTALDRLKKCFPGRSVIPIPTLSLIQQGGSIHCASMQVPAQS